MTEPKGLNHSKSIQSMSKNQIFSWERLLVYSIYPVILFGSILLGLYMMRLGVHEYGIIITFSAGVAIIISILEYVFPEHKEWIPSWKVIKVDLLHMALTTILPGMLFRALTSAFLYALAVQIARNVGFELWPHHWPLFLQLLLALHLADIGFYIAHRALHEIPSIWPFHAVHHSPEELYVIAANRAHPIQIFFTFGVQFSILWVLGINEEALLLYYIFAGVNGQLQHCNIKMRCGFLNWVFATPDVHRWHHSIVIEESDANYGNSVMLWDLLLGTRKVPKEVTMDHDHIGLPHGTNFPESYLGQLMVPFDWANVRFDREENIEWLKQQAKEGKLKNEFQADH